MQRRIVIPPGMENIYERYHYAPGVIVGGILYVSGQVGRDTNLQVIADPEAQFAQAFENVGSVLAAAGTSFDRVFELETWFTRFPADLPLFMQVKDRYLTRDYPTWTGFGVASLSMPGLLVEIKVSAMMPEGAA
jgi:enamine deaminase RidA (YjgF/YER057c/UK114 family)